MKNTRTFYLSTVLAMVVLLTANTVHAQNEADFSQFLQAEGKDASRLISAYATPAVKAISYGMTNGWYHTGKTHSKFGVDVGVTFSAVFIPTADDYFNPGAIGLTNTTLKTSTAPNGLAPAIFGPKYQTTYQSTYTPSGLPPQTVTFSGPEGLDLKNQIKTSALPVPMIQLGIGLIKNTDLKVRFIPTTTSGSSKVSMLGFGLMHDIKQHIPGIKMAPIDISILLAYNSVTGSTSLINSNPLDSRPDSKDGKVSYKLNSWVAQAIVSKKFAVLTLYGGLGYGSVNSNVDVTGTYTIVGSPASFDIKDPAAIKFSNTGIKATAGMRLKFGPIYLNGDYTFQKYNALTIGLGVSVR